MKCCNCSLVFINPVPSTKELTNLYPEWFYAYQPYEKRLNNAIKKMIRRILLFKESTSDPKFDKPGRILDIGCGNGSFLNEMKGWEKFGVEINAQAAKIGNDTGEMNIFAGDLIDAKYPSNFFDYIRSNHSFEHISNPNETLREIHRILKPDGKLLIGVPNINSLYARFFKKYWWFLGAPVHVFNYSDKTLKQMLKKHGFNINKLNYNSDCYGLVGSIQIYLNRNCGKLSEDGVFVKSRIFRILAQLAARLCDLFNTGDSIEVIATKAKV